MASPLAIIELIICISHLKMDRYYPGIVLTNSSQFVNRHENPTYCSHHLSIVIDLVKGTTTIIYQPKYTYITSQWLGAIAQILFHTNQEPKMVPLNLAFLFWQTSSRPLPNSNRQSGCFLMSDCIPQPMSIPSASIQINATQCIHDPLFHVALLANRLRGSIYFPLGSTSS